MRRGNVCLFAGCLTTARGRLFFCPRAAQAALFRKEAMHGSRAKTNSGGIRGHKAQMRMQTYLDEIPHFSLRSIPSMGL